MNVVMDIQKFSLGNTYFLETKRNIIMEGTFTKIIYSNHNFSFNGIFLFFPIEITSIEKIMNKYIMKLNPTSEINSPILHDFSRLELKLIEYYKQMTNCSKRATCLFSKQLYSGHIKIYKGLDEHINKDKQYIIKLSGIWETYDEVGITYKIIECSSFI